MPNDKNHTLERAAALLDCFTQEQPEHGVRDLARKLNWSTSTTGRLLVSMKDIGILSQNANTRAYSLGGKVLAWAGVYTATMDVRNRALPLLETLYRQTNETISLYVLEGNERVCVERFESPHNVRVVARIGRRLPLHAGSAGKVFLAFLSEARREEIILSGRLEPCTAKTIIDPDRLREEVHRIRKQGYAISEGEWILEASGVAAPVLNQSGEIIAAVTISGPTQRFDHEHVKQYTDLVLRVAMQISQEIGFRRRPSNDSA